MRFGWNSTYADRQFADAYITASPVARCATAPRRILSRDSMFPSLDLYFFFFFLFSISAHTDARIIHVRGRWTKALFRKNLLLRAGNREHVAHWHAVAPIPLSLHRNPASLLVALSKCIIAPFQSSLWTFMCISPHFWVFLSQKH